MNRTAIVLLASGLSRRYGRRDKMLAELGGQPLIEHAAGMITELNPLVRVAVCPSDRPQIGERLINRFVVAVNKKPRQGLGHSIAVGVNVALQFKPDAILIAMGDMPFVESWILEGVMQRLGSGGVDIVHSGGAHGTRPPTAFGPACFEQLTALDGDDGAKAIIGQGGFNVVGFSAPPPLLFDIDTREDLDLAREQFAIRERYSDATQTSALVEDLEIAPIDLGPHQPAGVTFGAQRR